MDATNKIRRTGIIRLGFGLLEQQLFKPFDAVLVTELVKPEIIRAASDNSKKRIEIVIAAENLPVAPPDSEPPVVDLAYERYDRYIPSAYLRQIADRKKAIDAAEKLVCTCSNFARQYQGCNCKKGQLRREANAKFWQCIDEIVRYVENGIGGTEDGKDD